MRAFRECVFNGTIMGTTTVYTSTKFNRLLASSPEMVIQAVAANVVSPGAPGKLSVQLQVSSDGRNWLDKYSTPEIDDADQSEGAVTTTVGHDDGTEPSMSQARLEITTSGSTQKMHLKLWVTGRVVVPGSARQVAAARFAAAARAAQAPAQMPSGPDLKQGSCAGACGCGGNCGGTSESPQSLAHARISTAARSRGDAPSIDRAVAAKAAILAGADAKYSWFGDCSNLWDEVCPAACAETYGHITDPNDDSWWRCEQCCANHAVRCDPEPEDPDWVPYPGACDGIDLFQRPGLHGAHDPELLGGLAGSTGGDGGGLPGVDPGIFASTAQPGWYDKLFGEYPCGARLFDCQRKCDRTITSMPLVVKEGDVLKLTPLGLCRACCKENFDFCEAGVDKDRNCLQWWCGHQIQQYLAYGVAKCTISDTRMPECMTKLAYRLPFVYHDCLHGMNQGIQAIKERWP